MALSIRETHKPIKEYFLSLDMYDHHGIKNETAIRNSFQSLLVYYGRQVKWDFIEEYKLKRKNHNIWLDGALVDNFSIPQAYWEAKDLSDILEKEVKIKFEHHYPDDNIIFQKPDHAIIYQGRTKVFDDSIIKPKILIEALDVLFRYKTDTQVEWEEAVDKFKIEIPNYAKNIINLIEKEKDNNKAFQSAFEDFKDLCQTSINPNISTYALEEMIVQHILTERIFSKVFSNEDFRNRNVIANEIERVVSALTKNYPSRSEFLKPLDRFYTVLEKRAETVDDYSQKQTFLNTVYEKFFQGFAVKVADTHGIVYTPQPIVEFMVNSVEEILKKEFGRSLSSKNTHIIDPFVGTGNYVLKILNKISPEKLKYKYLNELHANEIMLLPYYVASMNIEHEYYDRTGEYLPFPGICLVDTFNLAEEANYNMFSEENTERVNKLKETQLFVIIGNPPYNANQANENDNNKNRKYKTLDKRISETFGKDSKAGNKGNLQDPYVKAFRWAMDKIDNNGEGVIAFVSNYSFIDNIAFDGMRKHLEDTFDNIYIYNLKGDVRKNPKISGTTHNVFGIQVGVSINILVKRKNTNNKGKIYYKDVDDSLRKEERFKLLQKYDNIYNMDWKEIYTNDKHIWLSEGLEDDYAQLYSLGNKKAKSGNGNAIFQMYSLGITTNRDAWCYNFGIDTLKKNILDLIDFYNYHTFKYSRLTTKPPIDDFVEYDDTKISWSRNLKNDLRRGKLVEYKQGELRESSFRPFINSNLYFNKILVTETYRWPIIFPITQNELENKVICVSGVGSSKPFQALIVNNIPCLDILEKTQCFPLYTYNEDGTNRRDNITDWALKEFESKLKEMHGAEYKPITKEDIFYYVYGYLHIPKFRTKYAANLRRELPRIPISDNFYKISDDGRQLADIHLNYEYADTYPLEVKFKEGVKPDFKVKKMKYNKDKTAIIYNDYITLSGIPAEAHEYKLGNRSALDWIVEQYRVKVDKRSGIVNDPNRGDEPEYIINLIKKIIKLSLITVTICNNFYDND